MMSRFSSLLFALVLTISLNAQDGAWESLFNQKDLQNWEVLNGTATYKIDGDMIVGKTKNGSPNTFLATKKKYSDFILEYEALLDPSINSGVQIRSNSLPDYNNGRVHGYQIELDPSSRAWTGGIFDEGRRGWIYNLAQNPKGQSAFKNGQWNKFRVEAIGSSIRVWVNGIQTANMLDEVTAEGFIALQVHSIGNKQDEGKEIRWKNLRIKTKNLETERWPNAPYCLEKNYLPNHLSAEEQRKGWRMLWDGKSNAGWRSARSKEFPKSGWKINDGVLTVLESGGGEAEAGGDIITTDKFSSFELKLEFKITEGANSGIKYFVDPELNKGEGSSIGLEFQILDDKRHPDAKKGVKGNRTVGSLYDLIPASDLSVPGTGKDFRGVNEWNQVRLLVKGNHIEHWLNGFKVVEYERNTPIYRALVAYSKYKDWPSFGELPEGHILLQDHGNRVSFRSIKIREF